MAIGKEMEDWFLRGGERPKNGGGQKPVVTCQNCGGDNLADEEYCTHCGAALAGGTSTAEYCGDDGGEDGRTFAVTMERTVTVRQTATVRVKAGCEESAMDRAEELAEDDSDGWDWEDVPGTEEYEDCEAVNAEEA